MSDLEAREALITDALLHDLDPAETEEVSLLAAVLASPSVWAKPGVRLEDDIVRAILHSNGTSSAANAVASVTVIRPGATPTRTRSRPPNRFRVVFAAAAAIAAIALAGGALVARNDEHPDFKGNLTATAILPTARASAEMYHSDAGFRIELEAEGLPTLTPRHYYQGWLKNSSGAAVPIGTFSSSNGKVTLWSGVSPKDFRTFSVSMETTAEHNVPSGLGVLVGEMQET